MNALLGNRQGVRTCGQIQVRQRLRAEGAGAPLTCPGIAHYRRYVLHRMDARAG
jgi:hypothetical protein